MILLSPISMRPFKFLGFLDGNVESRSYNERSSPFLIFMMLIYFMETFEIAYP